MARSTVETLGALGLLALVAAGCDVDNQGSMFDSGGAAVTEEWFPGYRLSTCSYVCHILQKKVIDDLLGVIAVLHIRIFLFLLLIAFFLFITFLLLIFTLLIRS